MVAQLFPNVARATDDNGEPINGAKWKFYLTGTLTGVAVYADANLSTSLGDTVTANAAGRFVPIYLDPAVTYRARLVDSSDNLITRMDFDPVNPDAVNISAFIESLLDDANAAAARTTLGLGSGDSPTFTGLTLTGALTVAGITTLNGALTFNNSAITISSNYTATRAVGTASAGSTIPHTSLTTFTGHSGGTTTIYHRKDYVVSQGANNITASRVSYLGNDIETTGGTTTTAYADHAYVWLKDAGAVTNVRVREGHVRVDGAGGITAAAYVFNVVSITLGGAGTVNQIVGYNVGDIGHATKVNTAIGFNVSDITTSAVLTAAFQCQMNSGTNKWNLYVTGTADNWIEGKVRWGATSIIANASGTVTVGNVGPSNLAIQEWLRCYGTSGQNRYIPLFG